MKALMRILLVMLCAAITMTSFPVIPAAAESAALLTLPDALSIIKEEAFCNASSISKVIVPEGTTAIMSRAFAESTLTEINLPESLNFIANDAFDGCTEDLTIIAVEGSYAYNWAILNGYIESTTSVDDFMYEITNETVIITGYIGEGGAVTIPADIEGYPVTAIGADAFACSNLVSVTIPEGVTTIGSCAFNDSLNLVSASIPASAVSISGNVFMFCPNLETITVAESNTAYKSMDGVLFNAGGTRLITFPGGKGTEYAIPEGTTSLDFHSFSGTSRLKKVILPASLKSMDFSFYSADSIEVFEVVSGNENYTSADGVLFNEDGTSVVCYPCSKSIRDYVVPEGVINIYGEAFSGAQYLTTLTIPASATMVDSTAATYADNLTAFKVAEGNETYAAVDGVLYSKDLTVLCVYPYGKSDLEYSIPDGVVEIESYVFTDSAYLERVIIPESITVIGDGAFMDEELEIYVHTGSTAEILLAEMGREYKYVGE